MSEKTKIVDRGPDRFTCIKEDADGTTKRHIVFKADPINFRLALTPMGKK